VLRPGEGIVAWTEKLAKKGRRYASSVSHYFQREM